MSNDPYDSFKRGIKNDITNLGMSLFLVGGLFILVILMLSIFCAIITDKTMGISLKILIDGSLLIVGLIMIFNRTFLYLILKIWLIILVGVPVLFILFCIGYMFYSMFTHPSFNDSN